MTTTQKILTSAGVGLVAFTAYAAHVGSAMEIAKIQATTANSQSKVQAAPTQPTVQPDYALSEADKADTIYYVCEWSRQATDGPLEETCGKLQDAYQMQYRCETRSSSPSVGCWIEGPNGDVQESESI